MRLDRTLNDAAARFDTRVDELATEITSRMRTEIPELQELDAPELWEAVRQFTSDSRHSHAAHLRQGCALPGSCPAPDRDAAHAAAHAGVSLAGVLRAYRIAHGISWEAWLEIIEQLELDAPVRSSCTRTISRFATSYDDRLANLVTEEFERERDQTTGSAEKRRLRLIRDLIEGTTDVAVGLDYPLDLDHIGVIAWGRDARAALPELAIALDRKLVWAPAQDDLLVGWVGGKSPLDPDQEVTLANFPTPGDSYLAIGGSAFGLEGFRRTHRQAGEAHVVARSLRRRVTRYDDVILETFALREESFAREMVSSVLGGLDGPDDRSAQLRETLRAYFAAAQNAASTAAALGIHEQTVARRLQAVEERIGRTVNSRRAELELALRVENLLGSGFTERYRI